MGIIAAVNSKIVASIDRRSKKVRLATVAIEADRLLLSFTSGTTRAIDWASLRRAVGFRRDVHAGDETGLLLEFTNGEIVELLASVPGWNEAATALDTLIGARRFGEWHAEVLNAPVGQAADIWNANTRGPALASRFDKCQSG